MHFNRSSRLLLLCLLTLLLGVGTSVAQAVYGAVFGTVTDASGAAVPGAKVIITDVRKGTTETAVTNETGNYQVLHLIPDTYNVRFEAKGFKSVENKGVLVSADTSARVDAAFQIGGATEVVEVTSEAPQLKTDRADVAEILDEHITADLPLANRNFTSLELLAPGAVFQSGWQHASTENPQESQQIFVNGQKFGGTSWQLDGTDNKDPVLGIIVINPTLESVNEIKITTQNYDAEFGNATAGVITAQTKSGSNNLHGSVFGFRRSGANQARDPFGEYAPDAVTGRYIPPTMWGQFGGSIGGPIIKNKLFVFGDYQGTRSKVGTDLIGTVPTALVRSTCLSGGANPCDLSEYLSTAQVYNPNTGAVDGTGRTPYVGNLIPQSDLNSAAITILSKLPKPNAPGTTNGTVNNYVTSGVGSFNANAFNTRVDYQLKENFHLFGRYSYVRFTQLGPPAFGAIGGRGFLSGNGTGNDLSRDDSIATGFDYAVSPTLLTDFRFGFFRYHIFNNKYDASNLTAASDLGLPGLNIAGHPDTGGLPSFTFSGNGSLDNFGDVNCNCPLNENEKQLQFVNNWTKIVRNHTFKFGADLRYAMNLRDASDNNRTGLFTFADSNTASGDKVGDKPVGGGLALATMLTGNATTFARFVIASNSAGEHQKRFFFYGQDTWRVTPKLTLTLGLRWEDVFPETVSQKGEGGFVDLASGYVKVAGVAGNPTNGGQANNLTNFAPRIGAAYQLNPKTAIRGGYARSFDEGIFGLVFGTAMTHNIPVVASQTLSASDSHSAAFNLTTGPAAYTFPAIPANGLIPLQNNVSYPSVRPAKMKLVTVDAYNLSIQRQINNSTSAEIAYVGNWGVHVPAGYAGYNINQPVVGSGLKESRRPLDNKYTNGTAVCCNQDIALVSPDAHSSYNSLQTQINKRMSNGLQFSAFYTWSKGMDHSDNYFNNNPHIWYGPVDYNRAHVFTSAIIYDLPFGKGKAFGGGVSKVADYVIGGWQLSSLTSWASGLPYSYTYQHQGDDIDSGGSNFPNKVGYMAVGAGKLNPATHSVSYFIPVNTMMHNGDVSGAWQRPQPYTFGNAGRNSGWGPGMFTSDMSVAKNLLLTERVKGEFKMDIYNLFNHPVLGSPNSCVDCSGGGTISSLQGYTYMRRLQFGARFSF